MSFSTHISILVAFVAANLLAVSSAFALRADELVLIVNENVPESRELAEFYTAARLVPAGRILALKLTEQEEMPFDAYEREVVPAVRRFLRDNQLESRIKCLVTFYGVPLRIGGKVSTDAEKQELEQVRKELAETRVKLDGVIDDFEAAAKSYDPTFTPHEGSTLDDDGRRADISIRAALIGMSELTDRSRQREVAAEILGQLQQLGGGERVANLLQQSSGLRKLLPAHPVPTTQDMAASREQFAALHEQRHEAAARRELRELSAGALGLFGRARTLQAQIDYLDNDGTSAALDSELSLLWWNYYSRSKWQPNLLHFKAPRAAGAPRVLMTARLDAPQPKTVRQMILDSLRTERDGLWGKVVVDSRGINARENNGKPNGFGAYDQTLRNFANLVRTKSKLPLTFDDRDVVLPPNAVSDVAVYAGWYSLRSYVNSFTFLPGAVGFHIASFELISLKRPNESGWVANLLNDGVVATLGPVAEPYLHAFPAADEFFPLVMAGKLTMAEVYWRTTPLTSWMMSMIGDPLYRPFAAKAPLEIEDLPEGLRAVAGIGAAPTTVPVTIPATAPAATAPAATAPAATAPAATAPAATVPPAPAASRVP